jgi:hypothetical protein
MKTQRIELFLPTTNKLRIGVSPLYQTSLQNQPEVGISYQTGNRQLRGIYQLGS